MIALAMGDERAVLDLPGIRVFGRRFPTVEGFAVEDGHEAFLGFGCVEAGDGTGQCNCGQECGFHGADFRRIEPG